MTRRLLALALAGLLVLTGCTGEPARDDAERSAAGSRTGDADGTTTDDATTQAEGDETAEATPPPPPPRRACYRIPFPDLTEPTSSRPPVSCSGPHDAQTIHVGTLDLVVDGHAVAIDSPEAVAGLDRTCERKLARYVGGTAEDRRLTRLRTVWFAPTLEQADRGARWYRCDLVALAGSNKLLRLPPPGRLKGVLDRPAGRSYGLCGTAAPGDRDFERVICARRHAWRAVATIGLPRGRAYPGVSVVRAAGDDRCRDLVRDLVDDPLSFRYGWEWPTREQWRAGQRHGFCWAPD